MIDLAQNPVVRDEHAIQLQPANRVRRNQVHRRSTQALGLAIDHEGSDAFRSGLRHGPREQRVDVRVWRIGDEDLCARQPVAFPITLGAQGQRPGVGACARLGEGEGGDRLASGHRTGEAAGLLVRTTYNDWIRAQRLNRHGVFRHGRCLAKCLSNHAEIHGRGLALAGSAGAARKQPGQQSLLGQAADQSPVDPALLAGGSDRCQLPGGGLRLGGEVPVNHPWSAPPSRTMPCPLMPRAASEHR